MPVLRQRHGVQAIYIGSDLTADGNTIFARSEDIANSYNKLFCVSPAGRHTAGEVNAETATAAGSDLAAKVHAACVELVNSVK